MAQIRIVIDGDTIIDKDIGEWTQSLPELQDYLQPDSKPQPWMQAVLISLTGAAVRGQPFAAEVTTRPDGWTLNVETPS